MALEKSQVFIYSLNKQQKLNTVDLTREELMNHKGKILAVEWIYHESANECNTFAVGYQKGYIEIHNAEGKTKRPKILHFDINNLYCMKLFYHERCG